MAVLRFVHGGCDGAEQLDQFVATLIECAVPKQDAGVAVGHGADDENPDEDQTEPRQDPSLDCE